MNPFAHKPPPRKEPDSMANEIEIHIPTIQYGYLTYRGDPAFVAAQLKIDTESEEYKTSPSATIQRRANRFSLWAAGDHEAALREARGKS